MIVSDRMPRITAPTTPSLAPSLVIFSAAAISSSNVLGMTPPRYFATRSLFEKRMYVSNEIGIP